MNATSDKTYSILAVFFDESDTADPHPFIEKCMNRSVDKYIELNLNELFVDMDVINDYYAYKGSLTTPACD